MEMKDKHFEEARKDYQNELAQGNLTPEVVNNLTDLYLQIGAIDKAIDVMQKYVALRPDDLDARKKLGTLYQYAQRPDDYLKNLEEINRIKPTAQNLATLSDIYNFKGDYDKEAKSLRDLIISEKGSNPKHFVDLANIQVSRQDYTNATATLRDLQKMHPDQFTFENEKLLVSVLFDNKQPDEAEKSAASWLDSHTNNPAESAELINMVHFKGSVEAAQTLISHYDDEKINTSPELLESYILIEQSENKYDEAYQRLRTLYDAGRLPPALNSQLLTLATTRGEKKLTADLLKNTPLDTLSETDLLALLDLAATQHDQSLIQHISDKFQNDESRKLYPALTAALAVAKRQKNADALLTDLSKTDITHEHMLQVASICASYNRKDCVNTFLTKLPDPSQLTDNEVISVGNIYLKLHAIETGYGYMTEALKTHQSPQVEQVVIEFSAARGDTNVVKTWVGEHPEAATPHLYTDLYYAAANNNKWSTAAVIAEMFHSKYDDATSRSLLVNSYVKSGRYAQALNLLRKISPRSKDDEDNYFTCLVKLSAHNPGYRKELGEYASRRLRSGKASGQEKLQLVYALTEAGQTDTAMPYIRELALKNGGGQWASLYASILDKKGRHEEARVFWMQVAKQPGTTAKEKEDIAYTLLNGGDKTDAQAIFQQLANHARYADSSAVTQLLYLWGPRPSPDQMRWLETRYVESSGQNQQHWLTIINDHATPDYIIQFVNEHPYSIHNKQVASNYFDALAENHQLAGKMGHFIAVAKATGDITLLHEYADAAKANGYNREAGKAYAAILTLEPDNAEALREAGVAAFDQADYKTSETDLSRYVATYKAGSVHDKSAYLAYFYYAELLRRDHQPQKAATYYHDTLAMTEHLPATSDVLAIVAQSQIWSGNIKSGLRTYNIAIKKYPDNKDLKAAYVQTLLDIRHYNEARTEFEQLPEPKTARTRLAPASPLPVFSTPIRDYLMLKHNHELLIYFNGHVNEADIRKVKALNWANYTSDGYDTLLLDTAPGYKFEVSAEPRNSTTDLSGIKVIHSGNTSRIQTSGAVQ